MNKDIFKTPDKRWKDFDLNFSTHPDTEDLTFLIDDNAIKRSVKNLIFTNRTEKLFNPTFGSDITSMLFEDIDIVGVSFIKDTIFKLLHTYEPRIITSDIRVSSLSNNLRVTIEYRIISKPEELQVIETLIERTR